MDDATYAVVWPLGKSAYDSLPLAKRPLDLRGKTICELWEWLFRGDEIFPTLRNLLSRRYQDLKFVDYSQFGDIHGPREREILAALPELLKRHNCDVVISGVGA